MPWPEKAKTIVFSGPWWWIALDVRGLAIMREAQMSGQTFTRAFCRIMPDVWEPEVCREPDGVTRTGFCSGMVLVGGGGVGFEVLRAC